MASARSVSTDTMTATNTAQIVLIASAFFVLGVGIIAALVSSILSHPNVFVEGATTGDIIWNYFQVFGVIRPLVFIGASIWMFRLGLQLFQRRVTAANWARVVLFWLVLAVGVGTVQTFVAVEDIGTEQGDLLVGLQAITPWLMVLVLLTGILYLLILSRPLFVGEEDSSQQEARNAWMLLAPALIVFFLIAVTPLERVFLNSLTDAPYASDDAAQYIGMDNYTQLLGVRLDLIPCEVDESGACLTELDRNGDTVNVYPRPRDYLDEGYSELRYREVNTWEVGVSSQIVLSARDRLFVNSVAVSLVYTFFAILLQLVLGLFMAMLLTARMRGLTLMRLAILVPLAIPTLIATQFWDVMLREDASGLINSVLLSLGLIEQPQLWLLDQQWQIPAVILVIVWKETPTMALLLLPGLIAIPREVYQAAAIDGANRIQRFFQITLPMMRPIIGVALILRTMVTLRVFDVFEILLEREQFSMATYAYEMLIGERDLGYSSAVSVIIFVIALFFTVVYVRTLRIDES